MRAFIELAVEIGGVIQTTDPERARARDRELIANPTMLRPITPRLGRGLHGDAPARPAPARPSRVSATECFLTTRPATASPFWRRRVWPTHAERPSVNIQRDDADVVIVTANGPAESYLAELHAEAVVIRPDRYILGVASTATELEAVLARRSPPSSDPAFTAVSDSVRRLDPGDLHGLLTSSYQRGRSRRQPEAAARIGASLACLGRWQASL